MEAVLSPVTLVPTLTPIDVSLHWAHFFCPASGSVVHTICTAHGTKPVYWYHTRLGADTVRVTVSNEHSSYDTNRLLTNSMEWRSVWKTQCFWSPKISPSLRNHNILSLDWLYPHIVRFSPHSDTLFILIFIWIFFSRVCRGPFFRIIQMKCCRPVYTLYVGFHV